MPTDPAGSRSPLPEATKAGPPAPAAEGGPATVREMAEPSDTRLVRHALAGRADAFESLVVRYQALVCLVAYRQMGREDLIEDVAQEAFVKAFLHLHELDEPEHFRAWLLRITANLCLDHLRRSKHQGLSLQDASTFAAAEVAAAAHTAGRSDHQEASGQAQVRELRGQIVEAIYSLPEDYQIPAAMRYLEEIPYREIARRMGLREEALRKRIHRANQMLRRKLRKLWPEGEEL